MTIILVMAGCSKSPDYRDQRLAKMAQETVVEQVKQNTTRLKTISPVPMGEENGPTS